MEAEHQEHVAFYLTGRRSSAGLGAVVGLALAPAAFARYRDLASLRHDFPLVLAANESGEASVVSLSGLFDRLTAAVAEGADADRVRHHALRLEREIRKSAFSGAKGSLSALWDAAERALAAEGDALFVDSLGRLRAARRFDGEIVVCDRELPVRLVTHAWRNVQGAKSRRMRTRIDRLILKLSDILRADDANSAEGLSAERLKASVGVSFSCDIDFGVLSKLLTNGRPSVRLPDSRRTRIKRLLATLESQAFFPAAGKSAAPAKTGDHGFVFLRAAEALLAYRARLPQMVDLAKAMAVAALEIEGKYREATHDAMFAAIGADELGPSELAQFPDYLVCVSADSMDAADGANLMEALSAGLPMKVLVQTDDLAAPAHAADGHASTGVRVRRLAQAAISIGGVFVLEAASSHLYRFRGPLFRGLGFAGPAFLSVYSGAGGSLGGLPPYLAAAAAADSRAFPSFVYDPSAGSDWASRFTLDHNAQSDRDWPVVRLDWEDGSLQRASADESFTVVDFLACDARYASHFATVAEEKCNGRMIPVAECVTNEQPGLPDRIPYALFVDPANRLHRVLVDGKLIREARHCREQWRSLQELGGIRNSHAERLVAKERAAWEERARAEAEANGAETATAAQAAPATDAAAAAPVAEPVPTKRSNDPYIETPRCSSCNECIHINDRMFKYDKNKQAYIADPNAGTFAQFVEAAESCQVAIIHPGKPRNPNEPGLDALLKRAEAFA
jgi:hypothetical protein